MSDRLNVAASSKYLRSYVSGCSLTSLMIHPHDLSHKPTRATRSNRSHSAAVASPSGSGSLAPHSSSGGGGSASSSRRLAQHAHATAAAADGSPYKWPLPPADFPSLFGHFRNLRQLSVVIDARLPEFRAGRINAMLDALSATTTTTQQQQQQVLPAQGGKPPFLEDLMSNRRVASKSLSTASSSQPEPHPASQSCSHAASLSAASPGLRRSQLQCMTACFKSGIAANERDGVVKAFLRSLAVNCASGGGLLGLNDLRLVLDTWVSQW